MTSSTSAGRCPRARSPRCRSCPAARWGGCPCSSPSRGARARSACATASTMTTSRPWSTLMFRASVRPTRCVTRCRSLRALTGQSAKREPTRPGTARNRRQRRDRLRPRGRRGRARAARSSLWARSDASADRATGAGRADLREARAATVNAAQRPRGDRRSTPWPRRPSSSRRSPRTRRPRPALLRELGRRRRATTDPRHHHLVAVDRRPGRGQRPRPTASSGLHVFNPVPKMELVELALPAPRRRRDPRSAPTRCARRWARPPSRSPTRRASWSTACSSRTCSRPSA